MNPTQDNAAERNPNVVQAAPPNVAARNEPQPSGAATPAATPSAPPELAVVAVLGYN